MFYVQNREVFMLHLVEDKKTADSKANKRFWNLIDQYLSLRSENTQRAYRSTYKEWCSFLGTKYETDKARLKLISATTNKGMAFVEHVRKSEGIQPRRGKSSSTVSTKTVHRKYVVLRNFYRFLVSSKVNVTNPFEFEMKRPRGDIGEKRPTELIPFEKVNDLLNVPNSHTVTGMRDKTMLTLLFGTGIRRCELLNILINQICWTQNKTCYLRIVVKGGSTQDKTLPDWCSEVLTRYLKHRREIDCADLDDYLFCTYNKTTSKDMNKKVAESTFYRMFKKYCAEVGLDYKFYSPHCARATSITKLLSEGLSYREVQEFSGHASISTVEKYDKRYFSKDNSPCKILKF